VTQRGFQYFIIWGLHHIDLSKGDHHGGKIWKRKKIDIIGRAGALMGSTILRSAGYNDCVIWKKPRPSTLRC
jgi:Mb-OB3b family methanobactin precursor